MNALIRFARSARTAPLLGCQRPYDFISRNSSQFNRIPVANYSIIEPLSVNLQKISRKFSEKKNYFNESQSSYYEYKQAESSEVLFGSSSLNDSPSESNRKATEDYLAELEVAIRDKFKVERLRVVGTGAFGITFAAYTKYDYAIPSCAIKVVMPKRNTEEYKKHWMKQCEQEIGHLKSVEHDNIVTYHGNMFYQTEDKMQTFFVLQTEYLQRNLEQLLNEIGRPLSIEEAKRIALHIGTAIEHLHSIGIVHHDLKPSNTMIKFDPKQRCARLVENLPTCTAKVIDFGLARRYNNGQVLEKRFYGGTRRYKCKEKLAHRPYNPYLSDSYSFGIFLLELLIGIDELWAEYEKEKSMVAVLNKWAKGQINLTTEDKRFLTAVNGLLAQSETKRWKVSQAIDYIK